MSHRRSGTRVEALDSTRALIVAGVFVFHAALVFDTDDDFYVKNDETVPLAGPLAALAVVWAMPALFAIAGAASQMVLSNSPALHFLKRRTLRLLVPTLTGLVTLGPLPSYLASRGTAPVTLDSYADFYLEFFHVALELDNFPFLLAPSSPSGDFELGHLWFLVLLWWFCLVFAALWSVPHLGFQRLADWGAKSPALTCVSFAGGVAVINGGLTMEEDLGAWNRWAYLIFFLGGAVLASSQTTRAWIRSHIGLTSISGLALLLASIGSFVNNPAGDPLTDMSTYSMAGRAMFGAAGVLLVFTGLAALWVGDPDASTEPATLAHVRQDHPPLTGRRGHALRREIAMSVLPFYVLHQPIVVMWAFVVVRFPWSPGVKFVAILLASFASVTLVYVTVVRPTPVGRFLFGVTR